MVTPTTSIRVLDNGIYHKTFIQVQLRRKDGEEELFVKYGRHKDYLPLSVMYRDGMILLSAAMVGVFADIKLPAKEWLRSLERLGSKQKLSDWQYIINQVKKVA